MTRQYIGARYVPIFDGDWDITKDYDPLVIVLYQGNSYTSRTFVPHGTAITNNTYWALTGNYNAQVEAYRQEVEAFIETFSKFHVTPQMFGAIGDGLTDDTEAFNKAIQSGYPIYVPEGDYLINSVLTNMGDLSGGIMPVDNTYINMSSDATLHVISNDSQYYALFYLLRVNNVTIRGGNIVGDRTTHTYSGGSHEWGHGFKIVGCKNITIEDVNISNCTGDAIEINKIISTDQSENIAINNCIIDNVRRNGISIIGASNVKIYDNIIKNVNGTAPQEAIDLEPNNVANDFISNVEIKNNTIFGCAGGGINIWRADDILVDGNNIDVPNEKGAVGVIAAPTSGEDNHNISVINNNFTCSDGEGRFFIGLNCIISNNHFKNFIVFLTWSEVLNLKNALFTNNKLLDCLFYHSLGGGVYTIKCDQVIISNNIFINHIDGENIDVSGSAIDGKGFHFGQRETPGQIIDGIEIINNTFEMSGDFAIPESGINNKFCFILGLTNSKFNGNTLINIPQAMACGTMSNCEIRGNKFMNLGYLKMYRAISINNSNDDCVIFSDNDFIFTEDVTPGQALYIKGSSFVSNNTLRTVNQLSNMIVVDDGALTVALNNYAKDAVSSYMIHCYANAGSLVSDNNIS